MLIVSIALAECGDSILDSTEQCDDGGVLGGDGCDGDCFVEAGWACGQAPFELRTRQVDFPDPLGQADPAWQLGGATARHLTNGRPTLLLTGVSARRASFRVTVETSDDDDFVGWSVGDPEGTRFSLFDWRQLDGDSECGTAIEGLAWSRVKNPVNAEDLWCHQGGVSEQEGALDLGLVGWKDGRSYLVELDGSVIRVDGEVQFQGQELVGELGFYDFSQEQALFELVQPSEFSACEEVPMEGTWSGGWCAGSDPRWAGVFLLAGLRRRRCS